LHMHGNILPAQTGQAASLRDLADAIREAHAAVVNALSGAVEHAIRCGNVLTEAKKQTGHGRWGEFLRACDLGERQAQRYMRLALLAEQTRLAKSDLAGMTIEGAIKRLAPPKAPKSAAPATTPKQGPKPPSGPKKRVTHIDIIEVWLAASPDDRARAIDGIGLEPLLAAIPDTWWPLIKKRVAGRSRVSTPIVTVSADPAHQITDDLTIPGFLLRSAKHSDDDSVAASAEAMKARFAALEAGAGQ
jgi:hypothetical protein